MSQPEAASATRDISTEARALGSAAHVFARHCDQSAGGRTRLPRLGGRRPLDEDEIEHQGND
jgi:hypothetical protein